MIPAAVLSAEHPVHDLIDTVIFGNGYLAFGGLFVIIAVIAAVRITGGIDV